MSNYEIRVIFLYEFMLGHNATVATCNINRAFGEDTVNERTIQRWFKRFRSGDTNLENEPLGRRTAIDADKLKALIEFDSRQTVRELASKLGVHYSTITRHLKYMSRMKNANK